MKADAWMVEMVRRWWGEVCALSSRGLELKMGEGLKRGDGSLVISAEENELKQVLEECERCWKGDS